ncbi:MAG: F0F1 ATP synthase subunit A [Tenericutes bacterium]|nr:F0F1 ATP synthase subunit A [Mycoplasmatota bacterium]
MQFDLIGPISPAVFSTLVIIAILSVIFIIAGLWVKKLDPAKTPKGFMFIMITIVDFFNKFLGGYIPDKKRFSFFAPYLFTIIIFLAVANVSSLFGLTAPLSNIGVAMSFSIMTFIMLRITEFKFISIKDKLNSLIGPVKVLAPIMIPINLIGEFSTPFSMGLRLFVNLLSGAIIASIVYGLLGWFGGLFAGVLLHAVFDIFFGLVQAFVFFMLSTVSLSMASEA